MTDFWSQPDAPERNRRDTILKQIEIKAIGSYVRDGMRVLDVGCGDGETLYALGQQFQIDGVGVDRSETMLRVTEKVCLMEGARSVIVFERGDLAYLTKRTPEYAPFDLIYTERCLINLPSWEQQAQAIRDCCSLLKPGGQFVMCEHSQGGLDQCNEWRATLDLPTIVPPEFNRYLVIEEVEQLWWDIMPSMLVPESWYVSDFAGTYYFLSRIVNAKLAADAGHEPDYDSPINKLALNLPLGPGPGGFRGYSRIWAWRRAWARGRNLSKAWSL